jgi:hypothetical protein
VVGRAAAQCPPQSVEGAFAGWSGQPLSNIPATNPWTAGAVPTGGFGGGAAYGVTQSVTGGVLGAQIFLAHFEPTPRPLPPGGFGAIDLSVRAAMTAQSPPGAFGNVVAIMFCVEQGGVVYYAPNSYSLVSLNAGYGLRTSNGLGAADFVDGATPPQHPNFTSGPPVRFGFTTGNGNGNGGSFGAAGIGTTVSLYDEFTVNAIHAAVSVVTVAGSGVSIPPSLSVGAPVLGTTVAMTLAGLVPGTTGSVFTSHFPAAPTVLGGGYVVGLEFATLLEFAPFAADASGTWSLSVPIPAVCGLSGFDLVFQAVAIDPAGVAGFSLSNAVATVVGV